MVPRISILPGHSGGAIGRTGGAGQESGADTVDWVRRHSREARIWSGARPGSVLPASSGIGLVGAPNGGSGTM